MRSQSACLRTVRKMLSATVLSFVVLLSAAGVSYAAQASNVYEKQNEETGHYAVICDQADLLSDEEEQKLTEYLDRITEYCSAVFLTSSQPHSESMHEYAKSMLEKIGKTVGMKDGYNALIYVVDMNKRELLIYAGDSIKKVINTSVSNSITDNTYTLASKGDYYAVARETFTQLYQVLSGQGIAQPMKYITSALLAVFAGLGIGLILIRSKTKRRMADQKSILDALERSSFDPAVTADLISEKRVLHVERSGGGGGFSGGGGGGFSGGGGGGFSGGGSSGGHSF